MSRMWLALPSLVVCGGVIGFWLTIFATGYVFGERSAESPLSALLPGLSLLLGCFAFPAWMIASRLKTRRFLAGLVSACLGHIMGFFLSFPIVVLLTSWAFRGQEPSQAGQGEGILMFFIGLFGLVSSPVLGVLAATTGRIRDRRRGSEPAGIVGRDG